MITIYHNPRCSKSRAALKLLEDKGVEFEIVEYLKTPPDAETLNGFLTKLKMEPRQLMRRGEAPYKALELADEGKSRDTLIAAMIENPILIERPIVVNGAKVVLPEEFIAAGLTATNYLDDGEPHFKNRRRRGKLRRPEGVYTSAGQGRSCCRP